MSTKRRDARPVHTDDQVRIEVVGRRLGETIGKVVEAAGQGSSKRYGFFLSVFAFGDNPESTWISNGERGDMIRYLRELADNLEARVHPTVTPFDEEPSGPSS